MSREFTINSGGAQLHGQETGQGTAIVFLHAGVADRRMWSAQMAALGDTHRAVAFDMRGFGQTTTADESFSRVEDLRAVLDRLGIEQAALVGCSQGGLVALDFALAYPQRVTALMLIAPAVSGAPPPEGFPPELEGRLEALDAADEAGDLQTVNELEACLWLDGPLEHASRVGGAARELFLDMNGIALAHPPLTQERKTESPAYGRLPELDLPLLVLWGDLDFPHIRARCEEIVARVRGAQGAVIPGTAHLPNMEEPAIVNHLLRSFLDAF